MAKNVVAKTWSLPSFDGSRPSTGVAEVADWQLASGHYESHYDLQVIYPLPDTDTNSYARHRHAYPGIKYEIPIGVRGGAWPYKYEMITGPSWLSIEAETLVDDGDNKVIPTGYGILSGTAPAANQSAETVTVRVYDQDHNRPDPSFVDVEFTVDVDDTKFVFLDKVNGDDATADGTIGSPYKGNMALQDAGTHGGKTCYIRGALYTADSAEDRRFRLVSPSTEPTAYVGYPGESLVVDATDLADGLSRIDQDDAFIGNLRSENSGQGAKSSANLRDIEVFQSSFIRRMTVWDIGFDNPYAGTSADDNHSCVTLLRSGDLDTPSNGNRYIYVADCTGENLPGGTNGTALYDGYTVGQGMVERCTVKDHAGRLAFWPKGQHQDFTIRACNAYENITANGTAMLAYSHELDGPNRNIEACYNKLKSPNTAPALGLGTGSGAPGGTDGAVFYRNSLDGDVDSRSSPEAVNNEAINNILTGSVDTDFAVDSGNITTDVTFDVSMNLTGDSRTNHLGTKGAEVA